MRDARGRVRSIVEQKDATPRSSCIREGNTGVLVAAREAAARSGSAALRSDNAQGEYYLTDVIAMAVKDRVARGRRWWRRSETEVLGVNDRLQLAQLEARVARTSARRLRCAPA